MVAGVIAGVRSWSPGSGLALPHVCRRGQVLHCHILMSGRVAVAMQDLTPAIGRVAVAMQDLTPAILTPAIFKT